MDEWATNFGVQKAEGIQLTSDDGENYYVMTTQNLPAGSPVVFVPSNMILSSFGAAQELGANIQQAEGKLAEAGLDYQIPLFRVFAKILLEYQNGDQSPYFPWLNAMPRQFYNGASMTYACFDCLPPYVAWLSLKERSNFVNFQKALQFVPLNQEILNDRNLIKWAYNVAVTRSTEMWGERLIAPIADMFNHGTETEVEIQFDEEGNCNVFTTRDVQAGSPLRLSLGDPTDPSPLFATYGFLDDSSPATFAKLMHLQNEMETLGYGFSDVLFYKDTGDISPAVYDVVLYSVLAQDPSIQQGFYQACISGDEDTKSGYHQQYFPYTLEALKKHVNGFLSELDTLSATARSKDPSTHPRVPLILSHNEFVKSTFLKVKANLDAMG